MEKQTQSHTKSKNSFFKFLPKAASSAYFQNHPFSPNRDRAKPHGTAGKGFSGPIIPIIPDEARRRFKNGSTNSFYTQEPTSPKISCMGQIKLKKKTMNKSNNRNSDPKSERKSPSPPQIKKPSAITRLLTGSSKPDNGRRKSDASVYDKQPLSADRAPPALSQMKKFASGRETLSSFDWSSQFTPDGAERRHYYSDEEEEEEIIIPFSAPIIIGSGMTLEPRKEVNLWKRRTMDPPKPLQLN